jgi:hypothetical protein
LKEIHMSHTVRSSLAHSALAIGGTALWGAIEFVALCRSRWGRRVLNRKG